MTFHTTNQNNELKIGDVLTALKQDPSDNKAGAALLKEVERLAVKYPKAEQDDLCSEVCLRIMKNVQSFDAEKSSGGGHAWIARIMANCHTDIGRREQRGGGPALSFSQLSGPFQDGESRQWQEPVSQEPDPAFAAETEELRGIVARAVDELPPMQRDIVRARVHYELTFKEAAEVLGMGEPVTKRQYYLAIRHGLQGLKRHA